MFKMAELLGGSNPKRAIELIKASRAVIFDIDHTVAGFDGLQCLAKMVNKFDDIYKLMMETVVNNHNLEAYLRGSCDIIKPSVSMIEQYKNTVPTIIAPGVMDLIKQLQSMNKDIYLVSGGFKQLQEPILQALNITEDFAFHNDIQFNEKGEYTCLDESQPTMNIKGKAKVVEIIKSRYPQDDNIVVNFGDGILDSEACPPSDCFIRYTRYNSREYPLENAMLIIDDFKQVSDLL